MAETHKLFPHADVIAAARGLERGIQMGAGPPSREWARTVAMGPSRPGLQYSKTTSARSLRWSLLRPEDLGRLSHGSVVRVLACTVVDSTIVVTKNTIVTTHQTLHSEPCTMTTTD